MRGRHLRRGPLHGMGDADAGIYACITAKSGQDLRVGRDAGLEDGGREAIEGKGRVAAEVAVEPARDPPQSAAQDESGKEERQAKQKRDVGKLVAKLPRAQPPHGEFPPAPWPAVCTTRSSGLRNRSRPRWARRLSVRGRPAAR